MSQEITGLDEELEAIMGNLREMSLDPERQAEYERMRRDERLETISRLLAQSEIPGEYLAKSFDNFSITGANREAYVACREYAEQWKNGRVKNGMALFGDIGVGKSHLAVAVLLELITEHGIAGIYANVIHAFEMIRWSFDTQEANPLRKLLRTPFLVLDDLGSERPTVWTLEQVSHIIDYRLTEGLPIFVTSNALQWSGLARMLTLELRGDRDKRAHMQVTVDRIIDRLRGAVSDPLVMRGKSWRAR